MTWLWECTWRAHDSWEEARNACGSVDWIMLQASSREFSWHQLQAVMKSSLKMIPMSCQSAPTPKRWSSDAVSLFCSLLRVFYRHELIAIPLNEVVMIWSFFFLPIDLPSALLINLQVHIHVILVAFLSDDSNHMKMTTNNWTWSYTLLGKDYWYSCVCLRLGQLAGQYKLVIVSYWFGSIRVSTWNRDMNAAL